MGNNEQMLELLKQSQDIIVKLHDTIKDLSPLAEFAELVIADDNYYTMKEAADIVADKLSDKVGRNKMFGLLRELGILCDSESAWNQPYRRFIDSGYFYVKIKETGIGAKSVTLVTGKGLNYIYEKVTEYLGC